MKTNELILMEVKLELERFTSILNNALEQPIKDINGEKPKYFARCKRAAMDLKQELTKLTQSSKYKWSQ